MTFKYRSYQIAKEGNFWKIPKTGSSNRNSQPD